VQQVVQYKQQSRLDEKRKKAMDLHLSFIVDQTEKYSTWLTEGLMTSGAPAASAAPVESSSSVKSSDADKAKLAPTLDADGLYEAVLCHINAVVFNLRVF